MLNDKNWNYATGLAVKAILALLDEAAQADVAYVTVPQATDSKRHFCAGRRSAIQDLHSEFVGLFKETGQQFEAESQSGLMPSSL